jgi:hypothetical protein
MVVVAVRPFAYQGRPVVPGDVCVVEPIEAAALVYRGHVKWPEPAEGYGVYQRRDVLPDEPSETQRPRRSRRRDLTASA